MNIQDKIDNYIDAQFITKSSRKCNMHNNKKYNYLMAYVDRLLLLRNNFGANNPRGKVYTIGDRGKITSEIWRVQEKLKQLADKMNITLPNKYLN
jgi:hypothetical protein